MRCASAVIGGMFVLMRAGAARALDATPPTVHLEVDAPATCTSEADLSARVRERIPDVRFVQGSSPLVIRARFRRQANGDVAIEIDLSTPGAEPSLRRLDARSCEQAAKAVALMIAISIDPIAGERANGNPEANTGDETPSDATGAKSSSPARKSASSADDRNQLAPVEGLAESRANPNSAQPLTSSPAVPRWHFAAHAAGQATLGVAPGVMPGFAVDGLVGLARGTPPFEPAIALGVNAAWRTGLSQPGGTADFALSAISLDACPIGARFGPASARACATGLLGRLAAEGRDTRNPSGRVHRPFASLGTAALLTLKFTVELELSARFAVGANLIRDSFEFAPEVFHTVPPVSATLSVGIGVASASAR